MAQRWYSGESVQEAKRKQRFKFMLIFKGFWLTGDQIHKQWIMIFIRLLLYLVYSVYFSLSLILLYTVYSSQFLTAVCGTVYWVMFRKIKFRTIWPKPYIPQTKYLLCCYRSPFTVHTINMIIWLLCKWIINI